VRGRVRSSVFIPPLEIPSWEGKEGLSLQGWVVSVCDNPPYTPLGQQHQKLLEKPLARSQDFKASFLLTDRLSANKIKLVPAKTSTPPPTIAPVILS
jgi:hypothetical protein